MIIAVYAKCEKKDEHRLSAELCRELTEKYIPGAKFDEIFYKNEKGRPCLRCDFADISVTHCDGIVFAAIIISGLSGVKGDLEELSEKEVYSLDERKRYFVIDDNFPDKAKIGIDVEKTDFTKEQTYRDIEKRFYSADEKATLEKSGNYCEDFIRIWTQKESICKARGQGLSGFSKADSCKNREKTLIKSFKSVQKDIFYYFSFCVIM